MEPTHLCSVCAVGGFLCDKVSLLPVGVGFVLGTVFSRSFIGFFSRAIETLPNIVKQQANALRMPRSESCSPPE